MGFTELTFLHKQTNKKKIPILLPHEKTSTPRKTSEVRAMQKEKEKLKQGSDITNLTGFKEVLIKVSTSSIPQIILYYFRGRSCLQKQFV